MCVCVCDDLTLLNFCDVCGVYGCRLWYVRFLTGKTEVFGIGENVPRKGRYSGSGVFSRHGHTHAHTHTHTHTQGNTHKNLHNQEAKRHDGPESNSQKQMNKQKRCVRVCMRVCACADVCAVFVCCHLLVLCVYVCR